METYETEEKHLAHWGRSELYLFFLTKENTMNDYELDAEFVDGLDDYDYEDDGQPTEYEEWQDVYGGDDCDQGQYNDYDY